MESATIMQTRPSFLCRAASCLALTAATAGVNAAQFETPFKVLAGDKPIDVDVGHAAPLAADFDEDGTFDLLVGQFGGGKLRIYKNVGSNTEPKFDRFVWFKVGMNDGTVPSG